MPFSPCDNVWGKKMAAHEDGIEHCGKFQTLTAKDLIMHTDTYNGVLSFMYMLSLFTCVGLETERHLASLDKWPYVNQLCIILFSVLSV